MQEAIKKITSIFRRILIDHGFLKENLDMYKIKDWPYKNRIKADAS